MQQIAGERKSLYWSALLLNVLGIAFGILLLNPAMLILSIEFLTGSLLLMGISSIIVSFSSFRTKIKEQSTERQY